MKLSHRLYGRKAKNDPYSKSKRRQFVRELAFAKAFFPMNIVRVE